MSSSEETSSDFSGPNEVLDESKRSAAADILAFSLIVSRSKALAALRQFAAVSQAAETFLDGQTDFDAFALTSPVSIATLAIAWRDRATEHEMQAITTDL